MHTENRFSAVTVTADLWTVSVGRVLNVLNVSANWSLPMQKVQVHTFLTRTVHTRYETLGSVLPFLFHDLFHFLFAHRVSNGPSFCSDGDILLFMILNKTGKKYWVHPIWVTRGGSMFEKGSCFYFIFVQPLLFVREWKENSFLLLSFTFIWLLLL